MHFAHYFQYKPRLASWDYKEISGAITTFYDIRGLTPFTEYEFIVLAVNSVGRGPPSTPVNATTGETGTNPVLLLDFPAYNQCDQMARSFIRYFPFTYNNENLPNGIKISQSKLKTLPQTNWTI